MTDGKKILWNDGWSFALSEENGLETATDFVPVEIPHDWLIYDTANLYKSGEGVYKKTFEMKKAAGERYSVCFDGVYMDSFVYVNGSLAGRNPYGYSSFEFDVTDLLIDGENTVTVLVCHKSPNTRWYSGAGIYRNVWFKTTGDMHFVTDGLYITAKGGKIEFSAEITSSVGVHSATSLVCTVSGGGENTMERFDCAVTLGEGEIYIFNGEITLENYKNWSIDEPTLYNFKAELYDNETKIAECESSFGFREIHFDSEKGFFLNGEHIKLHGVCMHHDLGALGAAVNYSALLRQMQIMKEMGVNAIRTSHNMPSRELMEICDKIGLLVDTEAFDMWEHPKTEYDYARFFDEWYKKDIASWVRRDRNHPSIIMWSVGNEIYDTHASPKGKEISRWLCDEVKKHDPRGNAYTTTASNYMQWENAQKCAEELELVGYNYAERLYDEHHERHPEWIIYGSETSSAVRSRGIYHMPAETPMLTCEDLQCSDMDNSVVSWGSSAAKSWYMDRDRDFCCGQFIWTGFDYIGEPTPYSTKNSYFGIVDTAGFPKDIYYFYQAMWTEKPMIHLLPYWDWNIGQTVDVIAYTNMPQAELFLNGKSLGVKKVDLQHGKELRCHWKVEYAPGELVVKAMDKGGHIVAEDRKTSFSDSAELVIKASKAALKADGRDIVFMEISTIDKCGNPVENACDRVSVQVSGAGRLVGLDNGNSADFDQYKGSSRRLFGGKLLAMVQSTFEEGEITVTVSAVGLPEKKITLSSEKCGNTAGYSVRTYCTNTDSTVENRQEIPIRKIEIIPDRTDLDEEAREGLAAIKILPENSSYSDIAVKAVLENGIEAPFAEVDFDGKTAKVTAKGDGIFYLRAYCKNGGEVPMALSNVRYSVTGLGEAVKSPYSFVSACLYNFSSTVLNTIDNGAIGGIQEKIYAGYSGFDFGRAGSDCFKLHIGNAGDIPIIFELWLGVPGEGELLLSSGFEPNGRWDGFEPQEFTLPHTVKGEQNISIVLSDSIIFGGFEFVERERAFAENLLTENDGLYGDDFAVTDTAVEKIGNNVVIEYRDLDFKEGAAAIEIVGRTPNELNTIQLRYTGEDGVQKTQLIEFTHKDEYTAVIFPLERIEGRNDISFVFLPGSNFDFRSFRFIKE